MTNQQHGYLKLIALVLLCGITIGFFSEYDRYEPDGINLLKNGDFQQELKYWKKKHSGASVFFEEQPILRLHSDDGREVVSIRQTISNIQDQRLLKFSGKLKTKGVEQKVNHWQSARLIMVGLNADGRPLYNLPHVLAAQYGTTDWQHFTKLFKLNNEIDRLRIEVQLARVKGIAWAKDLSLLPVREKPAYNFYRTTAIMIWIAVASWFLIDYLRTHRFSQQQIPIAVLLCGIVVGVLMPIEGKTALMNALPSLSPWIWNLIPFSGWEDLVKTYSAGHFLTFVLLSLAVYRHITSFRGMFQTLGLLVLFAFISEVLQLLVDGRNPQLKDLLTDAFGIVTALILYAIWRISKWLLERKIAIPY